MTSVLLVKAPQQIVVVGDGRLSRGADTVSFDTTKKIQLFTPKYRIPHVSLGRFSHFVEYLGQDWGLAYAGTYALVAQISDAFRENMNSLYLDRGDGGTPEIQNTFETSCGFDDSYSFGPHELPKIAPRIIVSEFKQAFQTKCDEWSRNRGRPDCQFLLFGVNEETNQYSAYKIFADDAWSPGASTLVRAEEIKDGELAAIGSLTVSAQAYSDPDLQAGLEGWKSDQTAVELAFALNPSKETEPPLPRVRNWSRAQVEKSLIQIIGEARDPSVGGDLTVASGGYTMRIESQSHATPHHAQP